MKHVSSDNGRYTVTRTGDARPTSAMVTTRYQTGEATAPSNPTAKEYVLTSTAHVAFFATVEELSAKLKHAELALKHHMFGDQIRLSDELVLAAPSSEITELALALRRNVLENSTELLGLTEGRQGLADLRKI